MERKEYRLPFFILTSVMRVENLFRQIDFSQIQWEILSVGFTNLLLMFSFYDKLRYQ